MKVQSKNSNSFVKSALGEFRNNQSIFRRIIVIFMVFVVGMTGVMAVWLNYLSSENQQKILAETELGRIETAGVGVEQNLDAISQMMAQMMWSKDFCDYMITVVDNQTMAYRMIRQLKSSTKGENNILKKVWFFPCYSEKVYQSDSYETISADSAEDLQGILELRDRWILFAEDPEQYTYTYYATMQGRMFLLVTLNTGHEIGIMMCELDQDTLAALLSGSDSGSQTIYLYDQDDEPLLKTAMDYSYMETFDLSERNQLKHGRITPGTRIKRGNICCYESSRLGWKYISPVNWSSMRVGLRETARAWVPMILILICFAGFLSVYLMKTIYQPIQSLLRMVVSDQVEDTGVYTGRSEFDVLAGAYSTAQEEQKALENSKEVLRDQSVRLQATIEQIAPDVMETIFRKLLHGRSYDSDYLESIMDDINCKIPAKGRYVVYSCIVEPPENRLVSEREHTLYLASIQKIWRETLGQAYPFVMMIMERFILTAIVAYPDDCSAVVIKRNGQRIREELEAKTRPLPYRLWLDHGQICNQLSEIHDSYTESIAKIQYRVYAASSGNEIPEKELHREGETQQNGLKQAFYREKTTELLQLCANGDSDKGRHLLVRILEDIEQQECDLQIRKGYYLQILDELLEKVISYPLSVEDMKQVSENSILEDIEKETNDAVIAALVNRRCRELCQMISSYSQKSQYRYVEQARNYIEENYVNSNLSLNDVADHIGISGSYLSELFNEVNGKKFSAYLADYRVEKARQLLQATTFTITDIGFQCGFNSVQNFIRVFKKVVGYTPGQYRELKITPR